MQLSVHTSNDYTSHIHSYDNCVPTPIPPSQWPPTHKAHIIYMYLATVFNRELLSVTLSVAFSNWTTLSCWVNPLSSLSLDILPPPPLLLPETEAVHMDISTLMTGTGTFGGCGHESHGPTAKFSIWRKGVCENKIILCIRTVECVLISEVSC